MSGSIIYQALRNARKYITDHYYLPPEMDGPIRDSALVLIDDALKSEGDYAIMLEAQETGGYHIWSPDLPDCHSEGDTYQEALINFAEVMGLYLEDVDNE